MRTYHLKRFLAAVFIAVFLVSPLLSFSAFAALERHPYVQSVSDTRVVLHWRTTSSTTSRVSYGTSTGSLNTNVDDPASTSEHEVVITGLTPNTRYYYSVGTTGGTVEAGNDANHYFITAPSVGSSRKLRIWAIGDPGTNTTDQYNVRDAYYNLDNVETDVILTLGDNAYDNGTDAEYTTNFFNVYSDIFRHAPVWATRGNHEKNLTVHETAFSHPKHAESGGVASGSELYYSFDYGNVHFVCLDSFTSANLNGTAMYTWLDNDLASTTQEWIIAFWHHPPYTRSVNHDSDTEAGMKILREKANPILEQYGVDLQLGGHNHFYARTYLLNNHYGKSNTFNLATHAIDSGDGRENGNGAYQKGSNPEGAVYVLAGSSGKLGTSGNINNYNLGHPANYTEKMLLGSMVIDIAGDRMDVRMLRDNGTVQDYFTITKSASANQSPLVNAGIDRNAQTGTVINLDATVTDDGLPTSALSYSWSKVSGPGSVSFGNASMVDTTASFSAAGTYLLQLQASDSLLTGTDSVIITVSDTAFVDTDGDGMPDSWEQQYGFDPQDPADASLDADGDGISNLQEYQQGSDPHSLTLSFQDGVYPDASYVGTLDTSLLEAQPATAFGTNSMLFVDGDDPGGSGKDVSSLLRWDISAIPAGSVIESVEITVDVTNSSTGSYGVFEMLASWSEAEATWNEAAAGTGWGAAGASGAADRDSVELAAVSASATGSYTFSMNNNGKAVIQGWVDNPASNHGLVIADSGVTNGLDMSASEASNAVNRPKLSITYSAPASGSNQAPVVNAGTDQNIQAGSTASLNATVTDDGLPGATLTYNWSKASGPGTVNFASATAVDTTATFSAAGTYILQLDASDTQLTGSDTVVIIVTAAVTNQAPVVNAGADLNVQTAKAITLNTTVTDDGLPGATLSYSWSKVSGPGTVSFGNAAAEDTITAFSTAGIYVLQLQASDGDLSGSDQLTVIVSDVLDPNQAPVVDAGPDLAATSVTFNATVTDDGLPGGTLSYSWSKVSGPGNVTFGNSASANTTVAFSTAGVYVLQLEADDGALTASDEVTVTVPLAINAGPDVNVSSGSINAGVTYYGTPNGTVTYLWRAVSGPGNVTFADPTALDTSVSFSVAGDYVLRLEASDGVVTGSDEVTVTVPEPTTVSNNGGDAGAGGALNPGILTGLAVLLLLRWLVSSNFRRKRNNSACIII